MATVVVLTLWFCTHSFTVAVKTSITQNKDQHNQDKFQVHFIHCVEIDRYYCALKTLSKLTNKTFGNFMALFLICNILCYATNLHEVFAQEIEAGWTNIFMVSFNMFNTVAALLLSASIGSKMEVFREFLQKPSLASWIQGEAGLHRSAVLSPSPVGLPLEFIQMYENELTASSVALKAGNIFPITYSLVANVSTTCLSEPCSFIVLIGNILLFLIMYKYRC